MKNLLLAFCLTSVLLGAAAAAEQSVPKIELKHKSTFDATELERRFPEVVLTTMSQVLQRRFGPAGKVAADLRTPMPDRTAQPGSAQLTPPPPEPVGEARS